MAGMLAAPAVGLAVLIVRPRTIFRWKLLLACVGMLLFGLTPFATQPIRAAYFPAINEGEPTACRTKLELVVHVLEGHVRRVHVQLQSRPVRQAGSLATARRRSASRSACGGCTSSGSGCATRTATIRSSQALLAAAFLVLGLFGGWVHFQRDRRSFWYFGSLMFTMTLVLIYYLNFKLGASQDPASQAPHEVRDRDYFFLWSFSAWGVWAALGLAVRLGIDRVAVRHGDGQGRPRDASRVPTQQAWRLSVAGAAARRSFRCSPTGSRRRAPGIATPPTSPPTCSTRSSRTACS